MKQIFDIQKKDVEFVVDKNHSSELKSFENMQEEVNLNEFYTSLMK